MATFWIRVRGHRLVAGSICLDTPARTPEVPIKDQDRVRRENHGGQGRSSESPAMAPGLEGCASARQARGGRNRVPKWPARADRRGRRPRVGWRSASATGAPSRSRWPIARAARAGGTLSFSCASGTRQMLSSGFPTTMRGSSRRSSRRSPGGLAAPVSLFLRNALDHAPRKVECRALAGEARENWLEAQRYLNMDDLPEQQKAVLRMAVPSTPSSSSGPRWLCPGKANHRPAMTHFGEDPEHDLTKCPPWPMGPGAPIQPIARNRRSEPIAVCRGGNVALAC